MTSFGSESSTASPVLAFKPQLSRHPLLSSAGSASQRAPHESPGKVQPDWTHPPFPGGSSGRKRSHDEASIYAEPNCDEILPAGASQDGCTPIEGTHFSNHGFSHVNDTSSQPGAHSKINPRDDWAFCRCREGQFGFRDHKSLRTSSCPHVASSPNIPSTVLESVHSEPHNAVADGANKFIFNDFALHLGIGWRRLGDGEDAQAAARGWARFIENHYALTHVRMCLESKALQSYLVETAEGYFLFAENLRHGRLVGRTIEDALYNLQQPRTNFDGPKIEMRADASFPSEPCADVEMRHD